MVQKESVRTLFLNFLTELGTTLNKAITDDKKIINGIANHPNQKPNNPKKFCIP